MWKKISEWMDRICAVAGALLLSQFPSFFLQYRQQLLGRVAELSLSVEAMRQAALQSNKTIEQWVAKFLQSGDLDFIRQGEIMQTLIARWQALKAAQSAFIEASFWQKPLTFILYFDREIFKTTQESFEPGVLLTQESAYYLFIGMGIGHLFFLAGRFLFRFGKSLLFKERRRLKGDVRSPYL